MALITLIGTGHIFDIGPQIDAIIEARRPGVVCVELDMARYRSLTTPPDEKKRRNTPVVYRMLARMQERLAASYDTSSGSEMLAAVECAKRTGAQIAFIDVDAAHLFRGLMGSMSLTERIKFIFSGFSGLFIGRRQIEKQVAEFEENETAYLKALEKQFPTLKKMLIDDRDVHMAQQIRSRALEHAYLVAVVGEGHLPGISERLAGLPLEVITLNDLRTGAFDATPRADERTTNAVDFTVSYES